MIVSVYVKLTGVQETGDDDPVRSWVYLCDSNRDLVGSYTWLVEMKRSALKRNPAAIRDWVQASRKPLKPIGHKGKIKLGETVGPLSPSEWRFEVWRRCEGKCIMSGLPVSLYGGIFEWSPHHPLEKQLLAPDVKYDPRNGVVLTAVAHRRHTDAFQRVPFERLPDSCMDFALEQGSWAVEALLRAHPRENT